MYASVTPKAQIPTNQQTHAMLLLYYMNLLESTGSLIKLCLVLTHSRTYNRRREDTREHQKAYALPTESTFKPTTQTHARKCCCCALYRLTCSTEKLDQA